MRRLQRWPLPYGYTVYFEYLPGVAVLEKCSSPFGCWHGWGEEGYGPKAGLVSIAADYPEWAVIDTVFHEMVHALIDWHAKTLYVAQAKAVETEIARRVKEAV